MAAIPPPNSSSSKDSRTQKSESKNSSSMGKLAEAQLAHQGTRTSPSMSWYSVSSQGALLEYIQQQSGKITTEFEASKAVRKRIEVLEDELDAPNVDAHEQREKEEQYKQCKTQLKKHLETIQQFESELLQYCNRSIKQENAIELLPIRFSDRRAFQSLDKDIGYYRRLLEIKLLNRVVFLDRVIQITQKHLNPVLKNLAPEILSLPNLQMQLKVLGEETHIRGESAVLISFVSSGTTVGKIVYKPRDSITEQAIIQLFDQLNRLSLGRPPLPVYKILPIDDGSYWEYIDGKQLQTDPAAYLSQLNTSSDAFRQGSGALIYLQTICKAIGVTDLHHENVLLRSDTMQWVPIDMEVIKHGHATGLFGHQNEGSSIPLQPGEEHLIINFNTEQRNRMFRIVPVATAVLAEALGSRDAKSLSALIKKELRGFQISVSDAELEKLLEEDIKNDDVPVFYQQGETLFYGTKPLSVIGKLK